MNAPVDLRQRPQAADNRLGIIDCDVHPYPKAGALNAYLSERWEILEHFISCAPQCTQCVLAKPKKSQATALAAESISS